MATKSKTPTKRRATPKPAASKTSAKKKTATKAPSRDTLVSLRAHVDDIEKRLKRANSLTKASVKALRTSYEALDGDNHNTALTGHIETLSERLTGMIEQTRLDVAHDLKVVLEDPRLDTLAGALTKANQRLTSAEQNQAEAINAINVHIARLATAVDDRMQREESQRAEADALLGERIDKVEAETVDAIKSIGDKVVNISEELNTKVRDLRGEWAEQSLVHQQGTEEHKHDMARRIEAIEDDQRNQIPALERGLATISTRLEALEDAGVRALNTPPEPVVSAPAFDIAPTIADANPYGEIASETAAALISTTPSGAAPAEAKVDDAFAALELVDVHEVAPPPFANNLDNDLQVPTSATNAPVANAPDAGVAQTYPSAEYGVGAQDVQPMQYQPMAQNGEGANMPPPPYAAAYGEQVYDPAQYGPNGYGISADSNIYPHPAQSEQMGGFQEYSPTPPPAMNALPGQDDMVEYQTPEQTMENARPGADPSAKPGKRKKVKKVKKAKSPKAANDSGGSGHGVIRKVALLGGVAVIALFAYKTFAPKLLGDKGSVAGTEQTQPLSQPLANVSVSGDAQQQPFESVAPVGDYGDTMAAPNLGTPKQGGAKTAQKQTLEAAAANGNPIAQFQLGLSHLEAGRNADAVRLIRLSANQGQPAAQYRLAKLYETGIGVKVNGKTAKELLTRSAAADNRIAMHDLGHYYATGADGSSPNLSEAVKWFKMAADRGVLDSQFNLAVLYQGGNGVPRSLENAFVWYSIAGSQGDKIANERSEAIARELSPNVLKSAQTRVKTYAPKPVNNAANGVFKNLPWITAASKRQTASNKARAAQVMSVKHAQMMLLSLGYQVGAPDGAMGPNTRNAIMQFERANGLPETGRVNTALIERLQLAAGA